jgi:hypothetical protein
MPSLGQRLAKVFHHVVQRFFHVRQPRNLFQQERLVQHFQHELDTIVADMEIEDDDKNDAKMIPPYDAPADIV